MTQQKHISIPDKQAKFADKKGLSLSKILQNELEKRIEKAETPVTV